MHAGHVVQRVLSFGRADELLQLRAMVMRQAGFEVATASTSAEALAMAHADGIDAVLICHTVPPSERHSLISKLRELRRPLPILCVDGSGFDSAPETCILVSSEPAELLRGLQSAVTARRQSPSPRASI